MSQQANSGTTTANRDRVEVKFAEENPEVDGDFFFVTLKTFNFAPADTVTVFFPNEQKAAATLYDWYGLKAPDYLKQAYSLENGTALYKTNTFTRILNKYIRDKQTPVEIRRNGVTYIRKDAIASETF